MSSVYDFPITKPEAVDLNPLWLEQAQIQIEQTLPDATSLLVLRRGKLVFEKYFGIQPNARQDIQSVIKSLVSLLTGIALQQGILRVDQPVVEQWSYLAETTVDPYWQQVTVRHLLNMTAGLPSELTDPVYDKAWFSDADPVHFTLTRTLLNAPGTTFRYSNAGVHLLAALLAAVTGQPLEVFALEVLLQPLGISQIEWPTDARGRVWGCGNLHLTPREMLRLGKLVLQKGQWQGQTLVSESWITEMSRPVVKGYLFMEGLPDYGRLWWLPSPEETFGSYATGYGGQYIAVFPALDLVVVMTGKVGHHSSHRHIISNLAAQVAASTNQSQL